MSYVVFDTETTGFHPESGDRIVEIAAVRVVNGKITDETFDSLINPHRLMPAEAGAVNGITNEMLQSAPEAQDVIPKFLDFVGSSILVAHNAEFDMNFLEHEMRRLDLDSSHLSTAVCTVELARKKLPQLSRHNLDALTAHFGIAVERRHRALDDVIATADVFMRLHEEQAVEMTLF